MPPPIPLRFAILLELLRWGPLRASDLKDTTELTLQGVSYHLKQLESEGLVTFDDDGRRGRLTPAGIEAVHDHFLGLKAFVDLALNELLPIEECVALAGEALTRGDEVGLFMERGRLVAHRRASPSSGRVRAAAGAGELVVVTGLTGVVDLLPGTVHVVRLPPAGRLPASDALASAVARNVPRYEVLVAAGIEAEVLAERSGLARDVALVAFAPAEVARAAAQRGLDVLLVASADQVEPLLARLREETSATGPKLNVIVHRVG